MEKPNEPNNERLCYWGGLRTDCNSDPRSGVAVLMTCMSHKWFFGTPCPRCAAAAKSMEKPDGPVPIDWFAVAAGSGRPVPASEVGPGVLAEGLDRQEEQVDGPKLPSPARVLGVPSTVRDDLPYIEPPLPVETGDAWGIPAYLLRRQDGGFMYPSLHGDKHVVGRSRDDSGVDVYNHSGMAGGSSTALKFWPDAQLLTALSDHTISGVDRQPILEEAKKRHDQVKGYERNKPFL